MTNDPNIQGSKHYKAFISYNHNDRRFARWLHNKLERYKPPRNVSKKNTESLYPIFLDENELRAGSTLSHSIRDALTASDYLLVICSKHSVESKWVRAELEFMRKTKGEDRIIAVIPEKGGNETHLMDLFSPDAEHVAADFRSGKDKNIQTIKIIASLTNMDLDELYQRDARRKTKRMIGIGASLSAIAMLMGGLAVKTYKAERDANQQRYQSEELVAFMINEFRDDLEDLSRLDLLADVGTKAQDYFDGRDISKISDSSILLQSKTLRQLSDVDEKRGEPLIALKRIESAHKTSEYIVKQNPDNREGLLEHAQNTSLWAYQIYQDRDLVASIEKFKAEVELRERAASLSPNSQDEMWDYGSALQNVGTMVMLNGNPQASLPYFEKSLAVFENQYNDRDLSEKQLHELTSAYAWFSRALSDDVKLADLFEIREKQLKIFKVVEQKHSDSIGNKSERLNVERAIVKLLLHTGQDERAERLMRSIQSEFENLLDYDPENLGWRRHLMRSKLTLAKLKHKQGDLKARDLLRDEVLNLSRKPNGDQWVLTSDIDLGIKRLNARHIYETQGIEPSIAELERAEKRIKDMRKDKIRPRDNYNMGSLNALKSELFMLAGNLEGAASAQNRILELLETNNFYEDNQKLILLKAYKDLGMTEKESALRNKLIQRGFALNF